MKFALNRFWDQIYGSGLRACLALAKFDTDLDIKYFTVSDERTSEYLSFVKSPFENLSINEESIDKGIEFYYDHPLRTPIITPRLDKVQVKGFNLQTEEKEDVLNYGLLEGVYSYSAKKVVYDPQSPVNPIAFSQTDSSADELVYVINLSEARMISGRTELSDLKKFFFKEEKCHGLVLKMGAQGALVCNDLYEEQVVPVYKTDNVWPIGSGDVFSAFLAYSWFQGESLRSAAISASQATAIYCSTRDLDIRIASKEFEFFPLEFKGSFKKKVYLAGPFFTFAERWLVNEVRRGLLNSGLDVFSPYHDVGYGSAMDVAQKDIDGLKDCGVVFAITDGLDSGTLFEIGYANSLKIPVVCFVQNETEESLKMLVGSGCITVSDLTTAIYKTFWIANS